MILGVSNFGAATEEFQFRNVLLAFIRLVVIFPKFTSFSLSLSLSGEFYSVCQILGVKEIH